TTWAGLKVILEGLHETSELLPPLRPVIGSVLSFLDKFESAARNRNDYDILATELKTTIESLEGHLKASGSAQISERISTIIQAIEGEIKTIEERDRGSGLSRIAHAAYEEEDLVRRYRRIEQLFRQLQFEVGMGTLNIVNKAQVDSLLDKLNPVDQARYNSKLAFSISRRQCTEATRTAILSEMYAWSDDPSREKIYYMEGMAGTGKTTIACTVSATLESRGQLAAGFFCTRTSTECRDATRIFPTIAYQLARLFTPFQSALCRVLEKDKDIASLNTATQFSRLIKQPLLEVKDKLANNLVVVIDALDECDGSDVVGVILDMLFSSGGSLPIKFLITSRPEPSVRDTIVAQDLVLRSILYLHDVEKSLVRADVELYLHEELKFMSPDPVKIKQLAEQADNLFIYAATAVRYIRPGGKTVVNPQQRLETMLSLDSTSRKKHEQIDALYSAILSAALDDPHLEPDEIEYRRQALWTAVCVQEPVPIKTLAVLAGLEHEDLTKTALHPLRSVLHISELTGH
ncbi:hypothetical protein FRC11_000768, partial [Ceratobasidium sp. 423]